MRKLKNIILLFLAIIATTSTFGQQVTDLRLNEMLIKNETNYIDEYGRRTPWIEIFNTSYNFVNIGGCYLTDDTTGMAAGTGSANWYRIPTGDPKLNMPQRSFLVFFLDNEPLYGIFHTNFNPEKSNSNYVALISSNGKTIIDIFKYPVSLRESNLSYGCKTDGIATIESRRDGNQKNVDFLDNFTPGSSNIVSTSSTKAEKLIEDDPYGIGLALISMAVVFFALILIFCMLKIFGYVSRKKSTKKAIETNTIEVSESTTVANKESITGEEVAAISLALHYHLNSFHDEESEIITIENPSARYSPWSQKHLTIRRVERRS